MTRAANPAVADSDLSTATSLGVAGRLRAKTFLIDSFSSGDLVRLGGSPGAVLWQHDGTGLAGLGVALRIGLPGGLADPEAPAVAGAALATIDTDDPLRLPGTGPVVMGALPFDRRAAGHLVVPSLVVGRHADGRAWLTTVQSGTDGDELSPEEWRSTIAARLAAPVASPPDGFTLVARRPHDEWCALVGETVDAIRAGGFAKVVVAREVLVEANRPFVLADVLARLNALYPSCMVFAVEGFVGASPELLVSRRGSSVISHPLAGTVARSGDRDNDRHLDEELLASSKEREEHRLVVDAVAEALRPHCSTLQVPAAPSIVELRNVSHLGTRIHGQLHDTRRTTALGLAASLHPTPAVAGKPTQKALDYLRATEGFDRGRYAGPVGWMDSRGDGDWAVGIRSAEIDGARARLFAGVGVVSGSDARQELAETQLKLQALLAALVRP